jgi:hypothetical protein
MGFHKKSIAIATLVAVLVAPGLMAAEAPSLNPIACASSMAPAKVTAKVPTSSVAKVYFKAAGEQTEYYVDMRRAPDGTMWAFIPSPAPSTPSFTYRVVSTDLSGHQLSGPLMTATTAAQCPAQALTPTEQSASMNMVIGLITATQSAVPPGFLCRGIVSYITAKGELRPNDECRRLLAGAQPGAATTGTAAGSSGASAGAGAGAGATGAGAAATGGVFGELSTATLITLGSAGLIAAGVIIYRNNRNDNRPISVSRP